MASSYVIDMSALDLVAKVHIPALIEEVKKRRTDLGEASGRTQEAFDGDLFYAPAQTFRDVIDAIQDLQTETVKRLDMGAEGVAQIVHHHEHLEVWLSDRLRSFEKNAPKFEINY